ncbi:MAG: SDR family oxidoreductase [Acidimicrobiales bacterium]
MKGKVVVITGASSGIGKETAVALAAMGATTVMACRNPSKAESAAEEVRQRAGSDDVAVVALDLADLATVGPAAATIAGTYGRVDVLVNNAGGLSGQRRTTAQGFEQTFGVNHLGHFYLTALLRSALEAAAPSRVVNVASIAHRLAVGGLPWDGLQHERHYQGVLVYGQSKLANILFTRGLAARFDPAVVTANALHPGPVRTGFGMDGDLKGLLAAGNQLLRLFEISSQSGADTVIFLSAHPSVAGNSGGYWYRRHRWRTSREGRDDVVAERLWTVSEQLLTDAGYPLP